MNSHSENFMDKNNSNKSKNVLKGAKDKVSEVKEAILGRDKDDEEEEAGDEVVDASKDTNQDIEDQVEERIHHKQY